MWVSCRPEPPAATRHAGFTLLEVLVVLVIMSMAVAVIGPRLQNTYESVVRSGERAEVMRRFQRLPMLARERNGIELPLGSKALDEMLELPDGWHAVLLQALRIEANGACHASSVRLERAGDAGFQRVELGEPDCRVDAR